MAEAYYCPFCGGETPPGKRFCRPCGAELPAMAEAEAAEPLAIELPKPEEPERKWYQLTLIEFLIVFAIIGILAAIATPPFRKTSERPREKACYANMRVILGAIEMYNMDHESMLNQVNDAIVSTGGLLNSGQYLKSGINRPETGCSYGNDGDLTGAGRITCAIHGGVE